PPESATPKGTPPQPVFGSVRGRVSDEKGTPLGNVRVTVAPQEGPDAKEVTTDTGTDGSFVVEGVPPGRVRVVAKTAGYEEASAETNVVARVAGSVELVMKRTIKNGQLRGLVRSFNGKALAATIRV